MNRYIHHKTNNPTHSIGYEFKEILMSKHYFKFLSKVGYGSPTKVLMRREFLRTIVGSNFSLKVGKTISKNDYN